MSKALPPIQEKVVVGESKVLQTFDISVKSSLVTIAGCKVSKGALHSNGIYNLVRGVDVIWEGKVKQLKVFKSEVSKVDEGQECGIMLENWTDIQKGDVIQMVKWQDAYREFIPDK